jgi:hypothetical protein
LAATHFEDPDVMAHSHDRLVSVGLKPDRGCGVSSLTVSRRVCKCEFDCLNLQTLDRVKRGESDRESAHQCVMGGLPTIRVIAITIPPPQASILHHPPVSTLISTVVTHGLLFQKHITSQPISHSSFQLAPGVVSHFTINLSVPLGLCVRTSLTTTVKQRW